MTEPDRVVGEGRPTPAPDPEVVEPTLVLSREQFTALEAASTRLNLTVGQFTRRVVTDFLRRGRVGPTAKRAGWEGT